MPGEYSALAASSQFAPSRRVAYSKCGLTFEFRLARIQCECGARLPREYAHLLQALCESLGWDHGGVWSIDPQLNALRWVASWHVPAAEFSKFDALSRQTVFPPGAGLPRRVWSARLDFYSHGEERDILELLVPGSCGSARSPSLLI